MAINQAQCNTEAEEQKLLMVENDYWADMAQALARLEQNDDFKKVILDGYFKDHAVRQTSGLADPGVKARGERPSMMEDLVAISNVQYYLMMIKNLGTMPDEEGDE